MILLNQTGQVIILTLEELTLKRIIMAVNMEDLVWKVGRPAALLACKRIVVLEMVQEWDMALEAQRHGVGAHIFLTVMAQVVFIIEITIDRGIIAHLNFCTE